MAKYKIFAAIDVGSTAVTMKIVQLSKKNGIEFVDYIKQNLSLGSETYTVGKISYTTVEKICSVLSGFVTIMKEYGVDDYECFATTAIREAVNNEYIIDQINLKTGIKVTILNNEEERFLSNKALFMEPEKINEIINESALIVDVSSGSVQVSFYSDAQLKFSKNLMMGSLRVLEKLKEFQDKSVDFSDLLDEYMEITTQRYQKNFLNQIKFKNFVFFGWEIGYIKLLCNKESESYLTVEDFYKVYDMLVNKDTDVICREYNIPYENAVLFLPNVLLYQKFLKNSEKKKIYVPNVSIIDGICVDYAEKNGYIDLCHDFNEDIISSAKYCADQYHCDQDHYETVMEYADTLFTSLVKKFGLSKRDKIILMAACIFKETGLYMNINDHSKYSYDIVLANKLIGLNGRENELIACAVRLSENRNFNEYAEYASLSKSRKLLVSKIAAIMFLAEALDVSHKKKINRIKSVFKNGELLITAYTQKDITLETRQFNIAGEIFEEVFGIKAVLKKNNKV